MAVLEISHLKKSFGSQTVLDNVSFSVEKGSVFGFIGKNGAGKTTTMNIVLGLLKAESGEVKVNGEAVTYGDTKTNRFVGYLPDVPEFYSFLTAREYMQLSLDVSGTTYPDGDQKITDLLSMVGLEDTKKRISNYSRGMKQRLGIAQALINDPVLLICDEPTSALDPIGRKQLLSVLERVKEKTTVVFSTHILSDVEAVCDEVAILDQGKIVTQGSLSELKGHLSSKRWSVTLETSDEADKVKEAMTDETVVFNIVQNGQTIEGETTEGRQAIHYILDIVTRLAIVPEKIERKEPTMEEVFLEAIK
ncbi:ABC-2 type transport system ATP-binding protein [Alkalibacterium subtropicum]|uniref:ABC-2 type transport system ATP-binding protein n=1 Tax=Alkalibacterium subtropicum TaxID=753702 RepID=A0A1I1FHJ4_9LACT|nr:ABC transporter ATP-binding protein [Alkalibacterium subtropicum]SFB98835.1 ABC-2 type transport system ATP-binding protein [Alkalibacterium subtropicum]